MCHSMHSWNPHTRCFPACRYCADYYWRFTWYLPYFAGEWTQKPFNSPDQFKGCGGNGVWDLNEVGVWHSWAMVGLITEQAEARTTDHHCQHSTA